MKKMKQVTIFLLALILVGVNSLYGQKPIKPKLAKIESMLQSGDILGAKEMSDVAIVNEKLVLNAKTFYLHALVYVALDTTASLKGSVADATEIAITSFTKATEMAGDKGLFLLEGGFPVTMEQHWDSYFNFYEVHDSLCNLTRCFALYKFNRALFAVSQFAKYFHKVFT